MARIKNDPTAPEGTPTGPAESTRKRMTLNMSKDQFRTLEKLAERENCSIASAIRRSAEMRWSVLTAEHPSWRYDPIELERMPHLPNPRYYALIDEVTGDVQRVTLL